MSSVLLKSVLRNKSAHEGKRYFSVFNQRTFANWQVYTERGCLDMSMRPAEFSEKSSYLSVERAGSVFMGFAPKDPNRDFGYSWDKKQIFSLNTNEIGEILSMEGTLTLRRDPTKFKGADDDSNVQKTLEIVPREKKRLAVGPGQQAPVGGQKSLPFYTVRMNVTDTGVNQLDLTVPLTRAEFTVMRELLRSALPHLVGWSACFNPTITQDQESWDSTVDQ
eukprot:112383_1